MSDLVTTAIIAVNSGICSFSKFVSANDAGTTGAHQAGLYIPKKAVSLIFDSPGVKGENREETAIIKWHDGTEAPDCRLKYYGVGTRGEYRITRLGRSFKPNDLVIIIKLEELYYQGFVLNLEEDQNTFLSAFHLTKANTNALIDPIKVPMTDTNFENEPLDENELPESTDYIVKELNFRPKAHILTLLGEELIRDPVMAIYELVKNSYDADAKEVNVSFNNIVDIQTANIVIIDSGLGLTESVLENVWLEPGTAHRKPIDATGVRQVVRSPIYQRVPMGEKGVGRFAVHKLGHIIKLRSRPAICIFDDDNKFLRKELLDYELNLEIDWTKFTQSKYLSDVNIEWTKNTDKNSFYFKEDSGTKIEIAGLKESWTRGMARSLKRHTISMVSPKNDPSKFQISLDFNNNWLDRFPDINEVIENAPYKLTSFIDREYNFTFEYKFELANNKDVGIREIKKDKNYDRNIRVEMRPLLRDFFVNIKGFDSDTVDQFILEKMSKPLPFGELWIELYSFDLDAESLRAITYTPDVVKKTIRDHHGIKVFKDDLRVYDYGETGNDWLGLDLKRVNNKEWMSNNQNIGFIYLDGETSGSLIEKTNREGFINNESFDFFKLVLDFALNEFRIERLKDRNRWRALNKKASTGYTFYERYQSFVDMINDAEIPDQDKKQKLLDEASGIEADYEKTKETLLLPAGIGMTASIALHEIEKLVPRMDETVNHERIDAQRIRNQVIELNGYVQGILSVLKQAGSKPVDVRDAIRQALVNYELKFEMREITPIIQIDDNVETIKCDRRFLITILLNLLENSVYWLDTINKPNKVILLRASIKDEKISIIIADNGPGFRDSAEDIVTPFFSRREGGIGIGMYLIDTIMMKYGKFRIYTDNNQADLEERFSGAVVELIFNKP